MKALLAVLIGVAWVVTEKLGQVGHEVASKMLASHYRVRHTATAKPDGRFVLTVEFYPLEAKL